MPFNDLLAGEIVTELLRQLNTISRKSCFCKSSADNLITSIEELLPIIEELKYSGVELTAFRQSQLNRFSETLRGGLELAGKVLDSGRWNVYKNLQLVRKMEKLEKQIERFISGPMQAHLLADVHHLRSETMERFGRLERRFDAMNAGPGTTGRQGMEVEEDSNLGTFGGIGLELGKNKVKKMLIEGDDLSVVGIWGIGGSGKTTLANEICRDNQVRSYFNNKILFLTVSQSSDLEQLRANIWGFITGNDSMSHSNNSFVPPGKLQFDWGSGPGTLVVLDDVWSLPVLEQLIFKIPTYTTLVISRCRFPKTVVNEVYEVELLREDESMSLFCHSAFGNRSIPPTCNATLVKQIVNECKGLPLALKVIGASLQDQPEMYWINAWKRLSRGEPICETHESKLHDRMAISVECLKKKVRECFLDLGSFPEDKKIPLDALVNMWVEIHNIDEEEAFSILTELYEKNQLTLLKDARAGDAFCSYYEICTTQHDVLRDLAIHLSNQGDVNDRKRLLMPRRDTELPREWEKNKDQPFNAQIVSVHTGEMREMDWFPMEFPKAEVLILNFLADEYFLPPFIDNMPKLRALTIINHGTSEATLQNFSVFTNLVNLRSLWLEKVTVPQLSNATVPLRNLRKLSMILCKVSNSLDPSVLNLPQIFPSLSELLIDHCDDLIRLPLSICKVNSLQSMSITNCHRLCELPADLGMLKKLQILRLYASPELKMLPPGIGELVWLKYLDISQCINLKCLPREISRLTRLEKIDMRDCSQIVNLPTPAALSNLKSLQRVICEEEIFDEWRNLEKTVPDLHVQVAEKWYSLEWLNG
ncbi:putative disease resistance protein [Hibiscus syriacus]|uniref:Disease resistance protein n=1 Tax=Hibiscus syriacus TaxID=106335 RepID=A0A6A3AJB2_HIBSY|nr:probable disease resistance protein At5g04720 [Hibiscus syriacus]KAE8704168.1 putative disease resistance protein [Hibiscus syriacus]